MIRGTTPTHTFKLPFAANTLTEAYVTYSQHGTVKIEKKLSACTCSGNNLIAKLTQAETLSLSCDCITEIQVAAKIENEVYRSKIITVDTERILKDGEI